MQKLRKGDKVRVMRGKEKGKEGIILKVFPTTQKVQVEGINIRKKHQKANNDNQKGGIIDVTLPIPMANVAIIDAKAKNQPVKVKFGYDKANKKVRISKRFNNLLPTTR